MTLRERLRRRIEREGPITFAAFMAAALLDPEDGFYARGPALGARGAFATAPTLHPAFAEAVAEEVREAWSALGHPDPLTLVEVGPGDGTLAERLRGLLADLPLRLVLVEPAAGLRERQRARLGEDGVRWVEGPDEVEPFLGVVVANEVFDALPVRLLAPPDELLVGVGPDGSFMPVPVSAPPKLLAALAAAAGALRRGGRYAVREGDAALLAGLAGPLRAGRLVVVDYGGEGPEVHDGRRAPVRTYVGGQTGGDPLAAPGRQDLTADVDFAVLRRAAAAFGLVERRYDLQEDWLRSRGASLPPPERRDDDDWRLAGLLESRLSFRVLVLDRPAAPPAGGGTGMLSAS